MTTTADLRCPSSTPGRDGPASDGPSARPIRVLRVAGGLDTTMGGPPESTVAACLATEREDARNTLLFATDEAGGHRARALLRRLAAAGVAVRGFPVMPRDSAIARRWGVSPALVRWLWSNASHDVIHVHGALGLVTTAALLIGRLRGIPVVVSPHESLTDYDLGQSRTPVHRALKRGLRALYLRAASLLVFASRLEAEDSRGQSIGSVRKLVVPHPVVESVAREPCSKPPGRRAFRIGFLGRLHPKKNLDRLIEALPALSPEVRLVVAGKGPPAEHRRLESVAEVAGVSDRIEWRGWIEADEREEFFEQLDLLAMPSAYECFGMAGAEALARGIPVIASRTTGIAEIVARHGCGVVTTPRPTALAAAIGELATQPSGLEELRARAVKAAEAELSYHAFGSLLVSHYRQLASSAEAQAPLVPVNG